MSFPVIFHPFGLPLHAHVVFEFLAYTLGFQLYLLLGRRRHGGALADVTTEQKLWLLVGCVFGAFAGSKLLAWAESWPAYWEHRADPAFWLGGKTIVGGLIGGWAGVEIAKKCLGVRSRTGDAYVLPLCLGIAVGRVGCFLTGLSDHTHGVATNLPWAVDFGDGLPRHPTQLYELTFLLLLAAGFFTAGVGWRTHTAGRAFRWFFIAYFLFRFAIEFIKPTWRGYVGLSAIQWASLITAGAAAWQLRTQPTESKSLTPPAPEEAAASPRLSS